MSDDGGPAFPSSLNHNDGRPPEIGMTLRDYFASDAMKGWLASFSDRGEHPACLKDGARMVARLSYAMADAMLKARNA